MQGSCTGSKTAANARKQDLVAQPGSGRLRANLGMASRRRAGLGSATELEMVMMMSDDMHPAVYRSSPASTPDSPWCFALLFLCAAR